MRYPAFTGDEPCAQIGVDMFYPSDTPARWPEIPMLRQVCAGCPMLNDCREWAVRHESESNGFWGGMTGRERRAERARRNIWLEDPVHVLVTDRRAHAS